MPLKPMKEQNHPLYTIDRDHIDRLLAKEKPEEEDVIDLARLFLRYEGFPGAKDLKMDMVKVLKTWGISKEELNVKTREIWIEGYRPSKYPEEIIGSSFDTSEGS